MAYAGTTVVDIENDRQRKRLDSLPIITGIQMENPKDKDGKRKRSEKDENDSRRMETFKELRDEDEEVIIETRVISGLVKNIEDNYVKSLIECFNPVLRGSPDIINQQMKSCSEKWENKKDVYIGAIDYTIHGRRDTRDKKEQLKDKGIERLREILIREIENRMPKHCKQCDNWYIVQLKDKPEIHCMWCKVGIHDCMEINESVENLGFKWLCGKCEPVFTEHFLPKLDQTASFDGFGADMRKKTGKDNVGKGQEITGNNKNASKGKKSNNTKEKEDLEAIVVVEEDLDAIIVVEEHEEEREINDNINRKNNEMETEDSRKPKDENRRNNQNIKEICWFWKNKKCRYTTNCNKDHPEQCKEMLELGLCKDSRCKLLHPKICRNLFFNKYCPRGDTCWFVHPSKIKNNVLNNQNTQNSYNNLNNRRNNENINNHPRHNNQDQYMNQRNEYANVNRNFLEIHQPPQNNWSQIINQNQPMNQMMQNMLEKITRMESKMLQLEMARTFNYH